MEIFNAVVNWLINNILSLILSGVGFYLIKYYIPKSLNKQVELLKSESAMKIETLKDTLKKESTLEVEEFIGSLQKESAKEIESLKASLEAQQQKLSATLQKSVYASQIKYDHEIQVYKDVWVLLDSLRVATQSLRPIFDSYDPDKTKDEIIKDKLDNWSVAHKKFANCLYQNQPFYNRDVYNCLDSIQRVSVSECIGFQNREDRNIKEYYDEAKENMDIIANNIIDACDKIREIFE